MYRIVAMNPDGSEIAIYDPVGAGALPVISPRMTEELNEAGSLEFALVYGHAAFERLMPKKTYIRAELDGRELFYGRVLNGEPSPLTGQTQYICAGALGFLQDSEVPPDDKKSDGTSNSQTMTAEAFFRRCIAAHNSDIGNDPRRTFTVGIVDHSRKNETRQYQLTSFNDTKSIIDQHLLSNYGGFLRTRRVNGQLFIDWVEQYGDTDQGILELGHNIISLLNRMAGENLYTAIRPVGNNGLVLNGNQTIDIFPPEEMAEYGRIIRNVSFPDATTKAALQSKGEAFVSKLKKTMIISSEISLVDMIFTDEDQHGVNLGDTYHHIVGLEGIAMTVGVRNRDFENPQNDSCTLKNPKSFEVEDRSSQSTISKRSSRNSSAAGYSYKYIHEFQDRLELNTKEIHINAEQLELHAGILVETANEFERISHTTGTMRDELNTIEGTGVFQNSEHISNLAGRFRTVTDPATGEVVDVQLVEGAKLSVEKDGVYSDVIGETGMRSIIEQTASAIRMEVGQTISGMAHSVIEQTATYIRTEVENAASLISASVIEQTAEYVRTEVSSVASGIAWSVVEQTMTGIFQEVARKSKVYRQWSDPNNGVNELHDGDIWIKTKAKRTWNDIKNQSWNTVKNDNTWNALYGSTTYVWKVEDGTGKWQLVTDGAAIKETRTWVEQNDERYAILAKQVDTQGNAFESNLTVTAQKISTEVTAAKGELMSAIEQTSTSIRAHVEDVKNGLQSSITQTAQSITLSVSASKSELYSTIEQTATQIRMEVANSISDVRSTITQTAESITLSVSASKSELYSTIEQTATQIRTEVANTASGLQSAITQTASQIRLEVSSAQSSIWSSITQTSTQISLKVGKGEVISSINQTAESITISAAKVNLDGYVKATDITTNYLSGKISQIANLSVQTLEVSSLSFGTDNQSVGYYLAKNLIKAVQIVSAGNNTYKLQIQRAKDSEWSDVSGSSFSRATTLSGAWSSGTYTVTASPQGNSIGTTLRYLAPTGNVSKSNKVVSRVFKAQYGPDDEHTYDTGFSQTVSIDASSVYDDGYNTGYAVTGIGLRNYALAGTASGQSFISGYTRAGSVTMASESDAYLRFEVYTHGHTNKYYFYINRS